MTEDEVYEMLTPQELELGFDLRVTPQTVLLRQFKQVKRWWLKPFFTRDVLADAIEDLDYINHNRR